ncbi:MAG TPA: CocE/NonD family hydrolase [Gemmatimonadales bacterium]
MRNIPLLLLALLPAPSSTRAQATDSVVIETDVALVARDGTRLSADVYRPAPPGRYPVIVERTPYDNRATGVAFGPLFAAHRYVYVAVDVRGRYDSQGTFYPYRDDASDGHDAIAWAATQPWSDGRVGTFGGSYLGFNQWLTAPGAPAALQTMVVFVSPVDYFDSPAHTGGAFNLGGRLPWALLVDDRENQDLTAVDWTTGLRHLPLASADSAIGRDMPHFRDWVINADKNEYWARYRVGNRWTAIDIPVLHVGGWYDEFLRGTLAGFTHMRQEAPSPGTRREQRMLIGPWTHNVLGATGRVNDIEFGPDAVWRFQTELVAWYDRHLRDDTAVVFPGAPVRVFVMGSNRWAEFDDWPPPGATPTRFYLHSAGRANSAGGDGRLDRSTAGEEPADTYRYDPADPVPSVGGATCCIAPGLYPEIMPWGPMDQREVESRSDVLVYSTAPFDQPLTIVGPVRVRLHAASSAIDTDFTAKLVDVSPDGFARNLTDGIMRARYRTSTAEASFLTPGEVYVFDIDLAATANTFLHGHRLRLEISSSNFPWYDRNLNTGEHPAFGTESRTATQTILHDRARASYVEVTVAGGGDRL